MRAGQAERGRRSRLGNGGPGVGNRCRVRQRRQTVPGAEIVLLRERGSQAGTGNGPHAAVGASDGEKGVSRPGGVGLRVGRHDDQPQFGGRIGQIDAVVGEDEVTQAMGDGAFRQGVNGSPGHLAAALGGITAMVTVWKRYGKPDLSMAMNGALAGLVGITAACAFVAPWAAIVIGIVAGYIVVRGVELLDSLGIDDPVGAFPVHGMCGIWGTLAVGIFGKEALGLGRNGLVYGGNPTQFGVQILGSVTAIAFVVISMGVVFKVIDLTVGLRVSREEELRGLDIGEHGMEAYGGFQIFSTT